MSNRDILRRFMAFVEKRDDGCWVWIGGLNKDGYGQFWLNGKSQSAHSAGYNLLVGHYDDELELDHLCRRRNCVNPLHLEAVTHAENCRRAPSANRKKTHCPSGHEYTPENTMLAPHPSGHISRKCRQCHNARNRKGPRRLLQRSKPATRRR